MSRSLIWANAEAHTYGYFNLLLGPGWAMIPIAWRALSDDKASPKPPKTFSAEMLTQARIEELRRLNEEGYGIFAIVNQLDSSGGQAGANVAAARAFWIDDDHGQVSLADPRLALPLSFAVQSRAGLHGYWLVSENDQTIAVRHFRLAQKGLAARFGSDPVVCDPARLMRVPGFYNMKDAAKGGEPVLVQLVPQTARHYSFDEIVAAFNLGLSTKDTGQPAPSGAGIYVAPGTGDALPRLKTMCEQASVADGERNQTFTRLIVAGRAWVDAGELAEEDAVSLLQDYAERSGSRSVQNRVHEYWSWSEGRGFDAPSNAGNGGQRLTREQIATLFDEAVIQMQTWDRAIPEIEFRREVGRLLGAIAPLPLGDQLELFGFLNADFPRFDKVTRILVQSRVEDCLARVNDPIEEAKLRSEAMTTLGLGQRWYDAQVKNSTKRAKQSEAVALFEEARELVGYDISPYFLDEKGVGLLAGEDPTRVSNQRLWVDALCKPVINADQDYKVKVRAEDDATSEFRSLYVPYAAINDVNALRSLPGIRASNAMGLSRYLDEMTTRVKILGRIVTTTGNYGWVGDRFVYQGSELHGVPIEYNGTLPPIYGDVGAFVSAYRLLAQFDVAQIFVALVALGTSAASPLVSYFGVRNPVWCLASKSSSGKGSSVELATSIWYPKAKHYINNSSTQKGMQDLGIQLQNLPLVVNEAHTFPKTSMQHVTVASALYFLGDGESRVTSSKGQVARGGIGRVGAGFVLSESSVVDNEYDGVLNRVIELQQPPLPPDQRELSDALKAAARANGGAMGAQVVQVINQSLPTLEGWLTYYKTAAEANGITKATSADSIAFAMTGVGILNHLCQVQMDMARLFTCLIDATRSYAVSSVSSAEAFYESVINRLRVNGHVAGSEANAVGSSIFVQGEPVARRSDDGTTYAIFTGTRFIEELARQHRFDSERDTRSALYQKGLLIKQSSKGYSTSIRHNGEKVTVVLYKAPADDDPR